MMPATIIAIGDAVICAQTLPMFIPQGGAHVRQVNFFLPALEPEPVITTTVSGNSPGNPFAVWDITVVQTPDYTQIKVSATNVQIGVPVAFDYSCAIVVVGKLTQKIRIKGLSPEEIAQLTGQGSD